MQKHIDPVTASDHSAFISKEALNGGAWAAQIVGLHDKARKRSAAQMMDPVAHAERYYAAAPSQSQWSAATERATESVMSDMDTLHDWLYAQAAGVMVCEPYRLASLLRMQETSIDSLPNDELQALVWNAEKDLSYAAVQELKDRYLATREADVITKVNELLASGCAA